MADQCRVITASDSFTCGRISPARLFVIQVMLQRRLWQLGVIASIFVLARSILLQHKARTHHCSFILYDLERLSRSSDAVNMHWIRRLTAQSPPFHVSRISQPSKSDPFSYLVAQVVLLLLLLQVACLHRAAEQKTTQLFLWAPWTLCTENFTIHISFFLSVCHKVWQLYGSNCYHFFSILLTFSAEQAVSTSSKPLQNIS